MAVYISPDEGRLTIAWESLGWSNTHQQRAFAEGWSLQGFMHGVKPGIRHVRYGEAGRARFVNDETAAAHVKHEADKGSELHVRAIACVIALILMGNEDKTNLWLK